MKLLAIAFILFLSGAALVGCRAEIDTDTQSSIGLAR
jgi:hypothetical protein